MNALVLKVYTCRPCHAISIKQSMMSVCIKQSITDNRELISKYTATGKYPSGPALPESCSRTFDVWLIVYEPLIYAQNKEISNYCNPAYLIDLDDEPRNAALGPL